MVITSPGTTGLSGVTGAPAMFAQQVAPLSRGDIVSVAFVLVLPVIGMPLPAGPPTLAVRIMRANSPAAEAVTLSFEFELIKTTKAQ